MSEFVPVKSRRRKRRNKKTCNQTQSVEIENTPGPSVAPKQIPVPLIFLRDKSKWLQVRNDLVSKGVLCSNNIIEKNAVRMKADSYENYLQYKLYFEEMQFEMHSFSLQHEKTNKVVLIGIPETVTPEQVMQGLKEEGFNPIKVHRMTSRITKKPLPMFLADFHRNDDRGNYVSRCMEYNVYPFPFKKEKGPTQCYNCQGFFHVQSHCVGVPRCLKCAGQHKATDCQLPKNEKPTCVNCNGEHTANYRGCPSIPKMLPKKKPVIKKKRKQEKGNLQPLNQTNSGGVDSDFPIQLTGGVLTTDEVQLLLQSMSQIVETMCSSVRLGETMITAMNNLNGA